MLWASFVAHQQMIEIMKAYRRDSDIFAFDEPTAPLTAGEITVLFSLIRQLKERGKIIIYVIAPYGRGI